MLMMTTVLTRRPARRKAVGEELIGHAESVLAGTRISRADERRIERGDEPIVLKLQANLTLIREARKAVDASLAELRAVRAN